MFYNELKIDLYIFPFLSIYVSAVIIYQTHIHPLSANVSICQTPPPLFVSKCQHLSNPLPPLMAASPVAWTL